MHPCTLIVNEPMIKNEKVDAPRYHSSAMWLGVGASISVGCSVILRLVMMMRWGQDEKRMKMTTTMIGRSSLLVISGATVSSMKRPPPSISERFAGRWSLWWQLWCSGSQGLKLPFLFDMTWLIIARKKVKLFLLFRFLLQSPPSPAEKEHSIRMM